DLLRQAKPDFIAFNYYTSPTVGERSGGKADYSHTGDQHETVGEPRADRRSVNDNLRTTEFGWQIDPARFRTIFRNSPSRYHLQLIVTENGLCAYDKLEEGDIVNDPYRIDFLRQHIEQIQLAITDGVEVFGFSPWSAIDLVSTHQGSS